MLLRVCVGTFLILGPRFSYARAYNEHDWYFRKVSYRLYSYRNGSGAYDHIRYAERGVGFLRRHTTRVPCWKHLSRANYYYYTKNSAPRIFRFCFREISNAEGLCHLHIRYADGSSQLVGL